jgi:hemolysin activation/secretion protein
MLSFWNIGPSFAQFGAPPPLPPGIPPNIEPSQRSGDQPDFQPDEPIPPRQPRKPILPPITPPEEQPDRPRLPPIQLFVKEIRVLGSTIFSSEELTAVTEPYTNRLVSSEDLEELRRALTLLYVNKGFVNSGALLPDQDVADGVITFMIVEGILKEITIEGTKHFRDFYFTSRLFRSAGPPLNINPLQERLRFLLADPRIKRMNAELQPGLRRGESVLKIDVEEASPYQLFGEFNNFQTPTVGAERGVGTGIHRNLLGLGDVFQFTYAQSEGTKPLIDINYNLPLTPWDTALIVRYRLTNFTVIEEPFQPLDIRLDTQIFSGTIRQPIFRTREQEVGLSFVFEHLQNQTLAFGVQPPQPLIPGSTDNGFQIITALRFVQDWVHRTRNQVLSARSRFSVGIDALNATTNQSTAIGPDGRPLPSGQFFAWLGQVQWARRLQTARIQLLSRMDLQIANRNLFPLEEFAMGGRFTVRGYRENTLVRDNAFFWSFESRIPVLRSALGTDILEIPLFVDVGQSWNAEGGSPDPTTLASVGTGIRWYIVPGTRFILYWGQRLNHVFNPKDNLQDFGIHVQFAMDLISAAEQFFEFIEPKGKERPADTEPPPQPLRR